MIRGRLDMRLSGVKSIVPLELCFLFTDEICSDVTVVTMV